MDAINPYTPSEHPADVKPAGEIRGGITARQATGIIVKSGLGFALGGALLGCLLGVLVPGYYRAVFGSANDPTFSPLQVGFGLGLTQGLGTGLVLGAVIVVAIAISHRRRVIAGDEFLG